MMKMGAGWWAVALLRLIRNERAVPGREPVVEGQRKNIIDVCGKLLSRAEAE